MRKITHNKFKNSGILFELLVRKITSETMNNKDSQAIKLLKKYFVNTELAQENRLYQTVFNATNINESKSEVILSTIVELAKNLDREKLNKEKYNLIKEISQNFGLDEFFQAKITNYKTLASIYILLESYSQENKNPELIISAKTTILEHLQNKPTVVQDNYVKELSEMDKGTRFLVYKVMLEKFNAKFANLDADQKDVLKEYIHNISNTLELKEYINGKFQTVKQKLSENLSTVKDPITEIKLHEIIKLIDPILESKQMKDEYVVSLLQYQELTKELSKI